APGPRIDPGQGPRHSRTCEAATARSGAYRERNALDSTPAEAGFDFTALLHLVVRRRWLILATASVLFGAVALQTLRQPKVYGATASMVIDAMPPRVLDSQVQDVAENGAGGYWFTKEYTETQTRIIMSRAVSARVVEKLGLQNDPAFLGLP